VARRFEAGATLRGAAVTVLVLVALVGITLLATRQAGRTSRYRVNAAAVGVSEVPTWLPGGAKETGLDRPLALEARSVFDAQLPVDAAQSALKNPWVKNVVSVERGFPNAIKLNIEMRTPVAFLEQGHERIAVDGEWVVLERSSKIAANSLPLVQGPAASAPAAGKRLDPVRHAAWCEAIDLVTALRAAGDHPALETLRVRAVRVGGAAGRKPGSPDLSLVTDLALPVRWGIAPGRDPAAPADEVRHKLDQLRLALQRWPGLVGLSSVDLSYPGGVDVQVRR
jgi:cell division septal protein FtsQ